MAAITSAANGLFSAPTTWFGGVVPTTLDIVTINHLVTVDGVHLTAALTISPTGTLQASRTVSSSITANGSIINTGTVDYGTVASPIPANITAAIVVDSTWAGRYGMENQASSTTRVYFHGAVKTTNTILAAPVVALTNAFTVADAAGWLVGDKVVFGTTDAERTTSHSEALILATIDPLTGIGTTTTPFGYGHQANGAVSDMTKNVSFKGFAGRTAYSNIATYSLSPSNSVYINHLEVQYCGNASGNIKYGFRFQGVSKVLACYGLTANMTFSDSARYGIDAYLEASIKSFDDCASYNNANGGIYIRQSSSCGELRCNHYDKTGMLSSWSEGFRASVFTECKYVGCDLGVNLAVCMGGIFNRCVFNGSANAILLGVGLTHTFNDCIIGTSIAHGGYDSRCLYIVGNFPRAISSAVLNNCYDNSYQVINLNTAVTALDGFFFKISNRNANPLLQEAYYPVSSQHRDNAVFRQGIASTRIDYVGTVTSSKTDYKMIAPNNVPVSVTGYIMRTAAYDDFMLPKVIVSGLGITPVTWTMPTNAPKDQWIQFVVGATQTSGANGLLAIQIQGSSATGSIYIDQCAAPAPIAVDLGLQGYWDNAAPVQVINANFVTSNDLWNTPVGNLTNPAAIGNFLVSNPKLAITHNESITSISEIMFQGVAMDTVTFDVIDITANPPVNYITAAAMVELGTSANYQGTIDWTQAIGEHYYAIHVKGVSGASDVQVVEVTMGTQAGMAATAVWAASSKLVTNPELANLDAPVSTAGGVTLPQIEASTVLAKEATVAANLDATAYVAPDNAGIAAIPTTPLLTNDVRLNNIDAPISTSGVTLPQIEASTVLAKEATVAAKLDATAYTAPDNVGIAAIPTTPLLTTDARLNNLDVPVSTAVGGATLSSIEGSTVLAKEATLAPVRNMMFGGSEIIGNQLICYAQDNVTVLATYDLLTYRGTPTNNMSFVTKQVVV